MPTFGHDQGGAGCGSDGGHHGVALLVHPNFAVPPSPGLGGGKHATSTAHVAKGTLAGAVSATTTHAGDTSHGAASSPGLGRRLVT